MGSVDSGIKAAAWSPDDEQIILVTGEDNLVCMTRNFDVVHEEPLRSQGFGQGASRVITHTFVSEPLMKTSW